MKNKKEIVDGFLTIVFDETSFVDLKQMLAHPQGLDFGIISLVCSGIELIGALDYGRRGNSGGRFKKALRKYFPTRYHKYQATLWQRYRNGLAHQAFIKPGTATARNPDYKELHLWGVIAEGEEVLFIHPDVLADDFFQAVARFRGALNDDPEKIERAYHTIKEIYDESKTSEQVELHRSLDDDVMVTRLPLPKYLGRSEITVGRLKFQENGG